MASTINIAKGAAGTADFGRLAPESRQRLLVALFAALIIVTLAPAHAYADGGVHCVGVDFRGSEDNHNIPTEPIDWPLIWVLFDKNVSYARNNASKDFVYANLEKVHLRKTDGSDVPGARVESRWAHDGRREIIITTTEWLDPVTAYQVVVDSGIQAANGEDVSTQDYVFTFVTSDRCKNDRTLAENLITGTLPLVFAAGVATQVVRKRKAV